MDAWLVELVKNPDAEVAQKRIRLEPRGENAFGRDEQFRFRREAAFESNLPADLVANGPAALGSDPTRQGTRGDAALGIESDGCAAACGLKPLAQLPGVASR